MSATERWYMSDDEIKRSWNQTTNKRQQVRILAQLNLKSNEQVVDKLQALGFEIFGLRHKGKQRHTFCFAEEKEIWHRRFTEGQPFYQIAKEMPGATPTAVMTLYGIMWDGFKAALPTIKKALQAYTGCTGCTDAEKEQIGEILRRGF